MYILACVYEYTAVHFHALRMFHYRTYVMIYNVSSGRVQVDLSLYVPLSLYTSAYIQGYYDESPSRGFVLPFNGSFFFLAGRDGILLFSYLKIKIMQKNLIFQELERNIKFSFTIPYLSSHFNNFTLPSPFQSR